LGQGPGAIARAVSPQGARDRSGQAGKGWGREVGAAFDAELIGVAAHAQRHRLGGGGADRQVASGEQKRLAEPRPQPDR
jgi:hypothetical protein